MKKICHIIIGFNQGGAERSLYRLVFQLDRSLYEVSVISLLDRRFYSDQFEALGISIYHLGISPFNFLKKWWNLTRLLKKINPDVVQTWMDHANFIGGISARLIGCKNVIWGIRGSGENLCFDIKVFNFLSAKLSFLIPSCIVSPSVVAMENHVKLGYKREKFRIIPNGIAVPSMQKRSVFEKKTFTVGMLARNHPKKDYPTLLYGIDRIRKEMPGRALTFLLAGEGVHKAQELIKICSQLDLQNVQLLPSFSNTEEFYKQLDLFVLSSAYGEAFPNVVAEAMSCEIPCVVTDVGDAAYIVGDSGRVVPPRRSDLLAKACAEMIAMPQEERELLGKQARLRISQYFNLESMEKSFSEVYESLSEDLCKK